MVLAIDVLYYLNERFEAGLRRVVELLRPHGILIDAEPDFEGALLKTLVFDDLASYVEAFQRHVYTETCKGEKSRFRTFAADELREHYCAAGLEVLDHHGISLLPLILRIAMVRKQIPEGQVMQQEERIRETFDHLNRNGTAHSFVIWKTQKKT